MKSCISFAHLVAHKRGTTIYDITIGCVNSQALLTRNLTYGKWTPFILTQWPPKRFTYCLIFTHSLTDSLIHRRRCQPCKAPFSSTGAAGVRGLAHGHLDTWSGGTGQEIEPLPLSRQPTWTTEPLI